MGMIVPAVAERALLLDCGRKYFTPDWIITLLGEMHDLRLNALILHFSEDMGCRLECPSYPWLAGSDARLCVVRGITDPDEGKYLTLTDLRRIADAADRLGIELIPSFDSPGHMNYIVDRACRHLGADYGNRFVTGGRTAPVRGSDGESCRGVDLANPAARAFATELVLAYARIFRELGCTKFDIGGDELLGWGASPDPSLPKWQQLDHWRDAAAAATGDPAAVAYDYFLLYMNELEQRLRALGYTDIRMWNDDAYRTADTAHHGAVRLSPTIDIAYWTNDANGKRNTPHTYLAGGHGLYNCLNTYNYYVLKENLVYAGANPDAITREWSPYRFGPHLLDGPERARVKGSAFCIWCDDPSYKTQDEVMREVLPILRAYAAKAWYGENA